MVTSPERPPAILGFGTYDVRAHPRVGVLLDGLRQHGLPVTELNHPLGLSTAARVEILQQAWRLPILGARLARRGWALKRGARAMREPDVVVVGHLGHFDTLLARRLFPRACIVLDYLIGASETGRDRGETGALKQRALRMIDRRALASADIVVVDTDERLRRLPPEAAGKGLTVAVGTPENFIAARPEPRPVDEPLRVIFFGLFTPLQGSITIGQALSLLAERGLADKFDVEMVGGGQDLAAAKDAAAANPRVRWTPWVDWADLPEHVAQYDVCLGIFGTGSKAESVVPNKIFQGAAAGCSLVTSDTPSQRQLLGDAAVLVPPGDPVALADALVALHRDRDRVLTLRRAAWDLASSSFTPRAVVEPLVRRLGTLPVATILSQSEEQ